MVGFSLTAVDLAGLTRVELAFALLLAAAAGGLVLALGLAERRRTFAIATALGGAGRQLRAVVFGESADSRPAASSRGRPAGALLSQMMLVKVLTGLFDPPPSVPAAQWAYRGPVAGRQRAARAVSSQEIGASRR